MPAKPAPPPLACHPHPAPVSQIGHCPLVLDVHEANANAGAFPVGSHDNRNASTSPPPTTFHVSALFFGFLFLAANLSCIKYLKSRLPLIITAPLSLQSLPALPALSATFPKRHCVSLGTHLQLRLLLRCCVTLAFSLLIFPAIFAASCVGNPFLLLLHLHFHLHLLAFH